MSGFGAMSGIGQSGRAVLEKVESDLTVGIADDLIVVRSPAAGFFAIYSKPADRPQLMLVRRSPSKDQELLAPAWQAANDKARELGWIV
jgi:hypothetical protein